MSELIIGSQSSLLWSVASAPGIRMLSQSIEA